ncbi:hypothetical protein Leryth_002939 [Lithospermum erythrorhizon]|nr:hypothetical protein Leryth_002939 [Lithospermum erythrorhizon]
MLRLLASPSQAVILGMFVGLLALEATIVSSTFDYKDALEKSLLFFEAQKSGKLPSSNRIKWRGDSALQDGYKQGVDLVGGYYDAGDHVKFGMPMAYTVTMLSWAALDFKPEIANLGEMEHTLDAIKWGTDYFIKAHKEPNVLWGQVGDGESDHYCWERPEDMKTPRTAYKIDPENPGSDLAAETAAALAASCLAFKPYNSSYSDLLLVHAKQLFTFADRFRGLYDDSIQSASHFYTSSGYGDELLWAATWLYRATKDNYYLKYVVDNAVSMGGTGWAVKQFSWDNKYAGLQILLSKVLLEGGAGPYASTLQQYKAKADYFACACVQKNAGYNVPKTPGGLFNINDWNNMQYASSAAFLLAVYSDYLSKAKASIKCPDAQVQSQDLLTTAKSQADYILGANPKSMSYLIGYGRKYPIHVHHRGSSIASIFTLRDVVGCVEGFEKWYKKIEANPNILYGGLVGGPNDLDDFTDDRSNYEQTEPTLTGTGPLVGLFSKLQSVYGTKGYNQKRPTPPYHKAQGALPKKLPLPQPKKGDYSNVRPCEFFHSITNTWTVGKETFYRHRVTIKNTSKKPITFLRLRMENLTGTIWGLEPREKNVYQLPQYVKALQPGSEYIFVYVQGGAQAKVSIQNYY